MPAALHIHRRRSQTLLSFAACLALLAQSAGTMHLALVRHTRCLEHGEMIEAAPSASATGQASQFTANTERQAHGHDHCAVAALERHRLSGPAMHTTVFVTAAAVAVEPPALVALVASRRLLFAPKHSPPLV